MANFRETLEAMVKSRHAVIGIITAEEERALSLLREMAEAGKRDFGTWSITRGITGAGEDTMHPPTAVEWIVRRAEQSPDLGQVYVLLDLPGLDQDPILARSLKEAAISLRKSRTTIILLSAEIPLPPTLREEVAVLVMDLPTANDLDTALGRLLDGIPKDRAISLGNNGDREAVVQAALGLTAQRAADAFAMSIVAHGGMSRENVKTILQAKEAEIRKNGILEMSQPKEGAADIGGLDVLKSWFGKRTKAFGQKARDFGLPAPKGVLLLGVQGCGKSLSAKALSNLWRLPLLRLDVGALMGSLVGQSEGNTRQVIALAERLAPVILVLEELDKAFAGSGSGESDGGVARRILGTFLTWMQEKEAPVFIIATANDISKLPPELLRKGRFDEIFFTDLPTVTEREDIFRIHLSKRGRDPQGFDVRALAQKADGFSGAEIEQAVISALYDAFDAGREIEQADIEAAIAVTRPLSKTMAEQIETLRAWAKERAVPASTPVVMAAAGVAGGRSLEI